MTVATFSVLVAIISGIVVLAGIMEWIIWSKICKRLEVIEAKINTITRHYEDAEKVAQSVLPAEGSTLDEVKELREEQKILEET